MIINYFIAHLLFQSYGSSPSDLPINKLVQINHAAKWIPVTDYQYLNFGKPEVMELMGKYVAGDLNKVSLLHTLI